MNYLKQNCVFEWTLQAAHNCADPFNEVTLDAVVTGPDGRDQTIPGFWAGGDWWKFRYAAPATGLYQMRSVCSAAHDAGLHDQTVQLEVIPYQGDNPLYRHGPVQAALGQRTLTHADGTPFFWLADTWWMGLTKRLAWPQDFQTLANDRVGKGFSVIQIVAGLYPDMPPFDERGANEAGFPWDPDYARINPAYFDQADRRLQYLVEMGLMPCIVGCWGYFLLQLGVEKMQQHWRYLVARYGAYPVAWCLAGEWDMPFYLSTNKEQDAAGQRAGWAEVARYLRRIDGFHRPVSIHEGSPGRQLGDGELLDFFMLQTGHGDRESLPNTVQRVTAECTATPHFPVINSEVCYEGIGEACRQEVQRMMFWTCLLSGAAGHTYGANGIWQVNRREAPFGPSPHGMCWGNTPWDEAAALPGSAQVGVGKRILERYPWWRLEPHPEWVDPAWSEKNYFGAYAAGIPGELRVIYFPGAWFSPGKVLGIEPQVAYQATLISPVTGEDVPLGAVQPDAAGVYILPLDKGMGPVMPIFGDWVLVLENSASAKSQPGHDA